MTITDYIKQHHEGNQAAFARSQGKHPQAITRWIKDGHIIINHVRYIPAAQPLTTQND